MLEKQPALLRSQIRALLTLLGVGFTFLALVDTLWLQLLDAVFLAVVWAQLGFIGHDAGHRQIFKSARRNDIVGLGIAFLLGMVRTWWMDKHNRHHSYPNEPGRDPDVDIPVLAFGEDEAMGKRGLYRLIVKYQAYLFIPMLSMEGFVGLRLAGIQYMLRRKLKFPVAEPLIMIAHFAAFLGWCSTCSAHGMRSIPRRAPDAFWPLHGRRLRPQPQGMPMMDGDVTLDYLRRQVVTARNIKPNPVTDFCYGGLNYQIEHHLFPDMPRNRLGKTRKIVRAYCRDRGISYYETGALRAMQKSWASYTGPARRCGEGTARPALTCAQLLNPYPDVSGAYDEQIPLSPPLLKGPDQIGEWDFVHHRYLRLCLAVDATTSSTFPSGTLTSSHT